MSGRGRRRKDGTEFFERDGIWYARYRDNSGVRRRRSTGCASRDDAEIEHATWALQKRKQEAEPAARVRLASVLLNYAEHAKKLRSARDAGRAIGAIAAYYGGCFVSDLTRQAQEGFIAHLRGQGHSSGYMRRTVAILAAAVNMAKKDGIITDHPYLRRPPPGSARTRWLTPVEARRLLMAAAVHSDRLYRFVALALYTGAREEAILQLTWDRVDLDRGIINFHAPGHVETTKRRVIAPIADDLAAILREAPRSSRLVVGIGHVRRPFRAACRAAGLDEDVIPNTLRHTFASWAVQSGVPIARVAQALGNSPQMVERHYGHLAPDNAKAVADAVAGVMR